MNSPASGHQRCEARRLKKIVNQIGIADAGFFATAPGRRIRFSLASAPFQAPTVAFIDGQMWKIVFLKLLELVRSPPAMKEAMNLAAHTNFTCSRFRLVLSGSS
jgi:hypothetical protein